VGLASSLVLVAGRLARQVVTVLRDVCVAHCAFDGRQSAVGGLPTR
jgi:hypothetical protein